MEVPDDMPAHAKCSLFGVSLTIPITNGKLNLGTWQGIYLCDTCRELEAYAHKRLTACKYGNLKTSCKKCPTHCYRKDMREKIREVMRFSGPRMMLYHPVEAIRHMFEK